MMSYSSQMYGPIISAYLRKHSGSIKKDLFEIKDVKKEYFYIDTSDYMKYSNETLSDEYHADHSPMPSDESSDGSYLIEVSKFLNGEENDLKNHKKFYNYPFEFKDKSFPTAEKVHDLMHK